MLKQKILNRIIITTATLFTLFLLTLIPNVETLNVKQELEYVNYDLTENVIFLCDQYNYVAKTTVALEHNKQIDKKAKQLLEILIKNGKEESKIPSGFKAIIPDDTKILSLEYVEGVIKVNFSKEILNIKEDVEDKMIEAIVYTLTSIDNVKHVIIYVEGDILTTLPSGKHLPTSLDRSYGINKEYDLTTYKDVEAVTVYYVSKYNDYTYYVPVTKYTNDTKNKIDIIIEQLTIGSLDKSNLMSYLDNNTKLLDSNISENTVKMVFNEYIFNNTDTREILDEVITSISLSIRDNYNANEIIFDYKDKEIYKSVIKTIE